MNESHNKRDRAGMISLIIFMTISGLVLFGIISGIARIFRDEVIYVEQENPNQGTIIERRDKEECNPGFYQVCDSDGENCTPCISADGLDKG